MSTFLFWCRWEWIATRKSPCRFSGREEEEGSHTIKCKQQQTDVSLKQPYHCPSLHLYMRLEGHTFTNVTTVICNTHHGTWSWPYHCPSNTLHATQCYYNPPLATAHTKIHCTWSQLYHYSLQHIYTRMCGDDLIGVTRHTCIQSSPLSTMHTMTHGHNPASVTTIVYDTYQEIILHCLAVHVHSLPTWLLPALCSHAHNSLQTLRYI